MALAAYGQGYHSEILQGGSAWERVEALADIRRQSEVGSSAGLDCASDVAALLNDVDDKVVRSACEALGSMGQAGAAYAGALVAMLSSQEESRRCYAVGALGMLGTEASEHVGDVAKLLTDGSANVRASAAVALGSMGVSAETPGIAKCLSDTAPAVVRGAITALALVGPEGKDHAQLVAKKLADSDREVRAAAVLYFAKFQEEALANAEPVCRLLEDGDAQVRQGVVQLFQALKEKALPMAPQAAKLLAHSAPGTRAAAALALGAIGPAAASQHGPAVAALLRDSAEDRAQLPRCVAGLEIRHPSVIKMPACAAAAAIAAMKDSAAAPELLQLLGSRSPDVKVAAASALGELGGRFEDPLTDLASDPSAPVRVAACVALGKLAAKAGPESAVVHKVAARLNDVNPNVRVAALEALSCMGEDPEVASYAEKIKDLFADRSAAVRVAAVKAMPAAGARGQCFASSICRFVYDESPALRAAAVETLAEMGERGAAFADEIAELVYDREEGVRIATLRSLAKMGDAAKPFMHMLQAAKDDYSPAVQAAADAAISALTLEAIAE